MEEVGERYPCGPCSLPLLCDCGAVITEDNVDNYPCDEDEYGTCDVCDYCGPGKCPECGAHWHCGGCI